MRGVFRAALVYLVEGTIPARSVRQAEQALDEIFDVLCASICGWERLFWRAERPVDENGAADNRVARDKTPVTAVGTVIAIVTENEIMIGGNSDFAVLDMVAKEVRPVGRDFAGDVIEILGREIEHVRVGAHGIVNGIRLVQLGAIHKNVLA